jgi:hypothetical protein
MSCWRSGAWTSMAVAGGLAGLELLTGIDGVSSQPVRRIVLRAG